MTREVGPSSYTYRKHDVIDGAKLPPETKAAMHAALEEHERAVERHQAEIGYTALAEAERATEQAWHAAGDAFYEAFCALRDLPVADLAALALKAEFLTREDPDYEVDETTALAIAADIARITIMPKPKGTDFIAAAWAEAQAELAERRASDIEMEARWEANPTNEEVSHAFDQSLEQVRLSEAQLVRLPAPDLPALLAKVEVHVPYLDLPCSTADDRLYFMLVDGDETQREQALMFLDVERLARLSDADVPFYPKAFGARLSLLGVDLTPQGFNAPEGFGGAAFALIGELTPAQLDAVMAASAEHLPQELAA